MTSAPKSLIDPKSVVPTFYKLFYQRVICKNCGLVHSNDYVRGFFAVASGYSSFECYSMADVEWNIPVKVETLAAKTIPWCHICFHPDLVAKLPKPSAAAQRPISPSWAGTGLNPNAKPAKATKPKKEKKVWTGTVDDLDID